MFVSSGLLFKQKSINVNQKFLLFALISVIALPFCSTSKKSMSDKKMTEPQVSYVTDIAPVMQAHCSPCHFPNGGKQKFLDTYGTDSSNVDAILYRVQLPADSLRFMPFKSKKEPLNDSLVQVIKMWKSQNMPN